MDASERIQAQFDAYNRRDLVAFVSCYASNAVIDDGNRQISGRDAIAEAYGRLFTRAALRAELVGRLAVGPWVVDHERVHGILETPVEAIAVYWVDGDLISYVRLLNKDATPPVGTISA
jgi:hypothetical protein